MRPVRTTILALITAGALATTAHALCTASFVSHANAVCRTTNAAVAKLPKLTTANRISDLATTLKLWTAQTDQLSELSAPAAEAKTWTRFMQNQRSALRLTGRSLAALRAGESVTAYRTYVVQLVNLGFTANKLAVSLGLKVCAKSATPSGK